jgi:hypothetical protein
MNNGIKWTEATPTKQKALGSTYDGMKLIGCRSSSCEHNVLCRRALEGSLANEQL